MKMRLPTIPFQLPVLANKAKRNGPKSIQKVVNSNLLGQNQVFHPEKL